jgi:hypothetical protein
MSSTPLVRQAGPADAQPLLSPMRELARFAGNAGFCRCDGNGR